jgi:hypothetical protein
LFPLTPSLTEEVNLTPFLWALITSAHLLARRSKDETVEK